ncbi:YybH family protein [Rhizorhabdus dicambivorans]|nr:nuclear transport factor 2 family protein [Rhizorhabdus dicambivorans]
MTDRWIRDQLEVRCCIESYSDAVMRRDSGAVMALWADDCRWGVPDMPGLEEVLGKDAIRKAFEDAQALFPFVFLLCVPQHVAIDGDQAVARTYTTETLKDHSGSIRKALGRYDDRLDRIDGRWLFTERIWTMLFSE